MKRYDSFCLRQFGNSQYDQIWCNFNKENKIWFKISFPFALLSHLGSFEKARMMTSAFQGSAFRCWARLHPTKPVGDEIIFIIIFCLKKCSLTNCNKFEIVKSIKKAIAMDSNFWFLISWASTSDIGKYLNWKSVKVCLKAQKVFLKKGPFELVLNNKRNRKFKGDFKKCCKTYESIFSPDLWHLVEGFLLFLFWRWMTFSRI